MGRRLRSIVDGVPYHLTQRGNHKQDVFDSGLQRLTFLQLLVEACKEYQISVIGYCLMTNHVHIIAVPGREDSLAKGLRDVFRRHALYVNRTRGKTGHLWQAPFGSVGLDAAHLWAALRYVELNPVRAGLVQWAEQWPWSSAGAHVGEGDPLGVVDLRRWSDRFDESGWWHFLRDATWSEALLNERIRECAAAG